MKMSTFFKVTVVTTLTTLVSLVAQSNAGSATPDVKLSDFARSPQTLLVTDPDSEKKDYEMIKRIVSNIEVDSVRHVVSSLTNSKQRIDTYVKTHTTGYEFYTGTSAYEFALPAARRNYHFDHSISELDRALERFNLIKEHLAFVGFEAKELDTLDAKINRVLGTLYNFRGGSSDLKTSVERLERVLKIVGDSKDKITQDELYETYTILAGSLHELSEISKNSFATKAYYLNKELRYVWNLTVAKNASNEKLKDVKLLELVKAYYYSVDMDSADYKNDYKPYFEKYAATFANSGTAKTTATDKAATPAAK